MSVNEHPINKGKKKTPVPLKRRLLVLVLICWIVPVILIFLFVTVSYRNSIISKTESLMQEWAKNYTAYHAQKINEAIDMSQKISYEKIIEENWKKYKSHDLTYAQFYKQVYANLKSKYKNDNRFIMSVFYLSDNEKQIFYTTRQSNDYINTYFKYVEKEANKITKQDTSDPHVLVINQRIYIIRNLYTTTKYTKFGTLIVELNKDKLFEGLFKNKDYEFGFFINNTNSLVNCSIETKSPEDTLIIKNFRKSFSPNNNRKIIKGEDRIYTGFLYQQKFADYYFGIVIIANKLVIYSELDQVNKLILIILFILIPVFIYMMYFISKHITKPISRMIDASRELQEGNIGMQIEGESMPNTEFMYLLESFNRMSAEIKEMFDYAYNEELAKIEAKIIALQSQINPHFLNNTLEMMNWQARMAGDIEVSKMIEALGTLLDYSMDRTNKKLINLSEELRCADAYFYIVSMRFGQRLRVEKKVDENLMSIKVPQLILQPILENSIVHGVEIVKSGTITLKVYKQDNNLVLQIINTGRGMTPEDQERVNRILEGTLSIPNEEGKHVSLGIRNVNERIKLIYGDEFGLTIKPVSDTETASTIIIPCEPVNLSSKGQRPKLLS